MDTIMVQMLITPVEAQGYLAKAAQKRRLSLNLSQKSLSDRSGVSLGSLKKFEQTGRISLESLLRIALILGCLQDFTQLFRLPSPESFLSLDDLLKQKIRKRGRG
jgi:transcriptional regulator with XRE-family HTH domain